ncbi:MAG: hypothetical protein F7C09_01380 [Aeropyrum sp.]|nr:hypothetical protein [Aeropyrum sp.]
MYRAVVTAILTAIILVSLLYPIEALSSSDPQTWASCSVPIVAVSSGGGGVVSTLTVTISSPGSGRVFISTSPASQIDTLGSARVAAFAASILAGVNMGSYDFYYQIVSPSIIVGGPSAGLAMAIATYALLTGSECPEGFAATGMILPDGSVGPVGGLKEKLEAAAESGYDIFLIPAGQEQYTYVARRVERIGPLVRIVSEPVTVDLVKLGEDLGVSVVGVSTLMEAAQALGLPTPNLETGFKPPEYVSSRMEEFARGNIEFARGEANPLSGAEGALGELARLALDRAARAEQLVDEGFVFAAAANSLLAAAYAESASTLASLIEGQSLNVTSIVEDATSSLDTALDALSNTEVQGLHSFDAIIKAYGVAGLASYRLSKAVESLDQEDGEYYLPRSLLGGVSVEPLIDLYYARWLAEWALFWASLASELSGPSIDPGSIEELSKLLVSQAATTSAYTDYIASETGKERAEQAIYLASLAITATSPLEAIGYSIESISQATIYLNREFSLEPERTALSIAAVAARLAGSFESPPPHPTLLLQSMPGYAEGWERLAVASKALMYLAADALASGYLGSMVDRNLEQEGARSPMVETVVVTKIKENTVTETMEVTITRQPGGLGLGFVVLMSAAAAIVGLVIGLAAGFIIRSIL